MGKMLVVFIGFCLVTGCASSTAYDVRPASFSSGSNSFLKIMKSAHDAVHDVTSVMP